MSNTITKDSEKYKVLLKLVNKILNNIGKESVDDLIKFIDIDREDIIKDANTKSLNEMENEIFKHYNKKKSGYYRKTDAIVLNCLRGLVKEAGYNLIKKQKGINTQINGKSYERTHMIYSINQTH